MMNNLLNNSGLRKYQQTEDMNPAISLNEKEQKLRCPFRVPGRSFSSSHQSSVAFNPLSRAAITPKVSPRLSWTGIFPLPTMGSPGFRQARMKGLLKKGQVLKNWQLNVSAFSTRDDTSHNPIQSFSIVVPVSRCHKTSICLPSYIYSLYMDSCPHPPPVPAAHNTKIQTTFSSRVLMSGSFLNDNLFLIK